MLMSSSPNSSSSDGCWKVDQHQGLIHRTEAPAAHEAAAMLLLLQLVVLQQGSQPVEGAALADGRAEACPRHRRDGR